MSPAHPRGRPRRRARRACDHRVSSPTGGPHAGTSCWKLVLPKGSLEKATLDLFEAADLNVSRSSSVEGKASIDDPRIDEVRILRPQRDPQLRRRRPLRPRHHRPGLGRGDRSDVTILGDLQYSKCLEPPRSGSSWPCRATRHRRRVEDLPQGVRASSEYPSSRRRFFEKHGIQADIRLTYGATEAKVPDIVDCIVDGTETGRALRAAGLKIIATSSAATPS